MYREPCTGTPYAREKPNDNSVPDQFDRSYVVWLCNCGRSLVIQGERYHQIQSWPRSGVVRVLGAWISFSPLVRTHPISNFNTPRASKLVLTYPWTGSRCQTIIQDHAFVFSWYVQRYTIYMGESAVIDHKYRNVYPGLQWSIIHYDSQWSIHEFRVWQHWQDFPWMIQISENGVEIALWRRVVRLALQSVETGWTPPMVASFDYPHLELVWPVERGRFLTPVLLDLLQPLPLRVPLLHDLQAFYY